MNYFQRSGAGYDRYRGHYSPRPSTMPPAMAYPGGGSYAAGPMPASPGMAEMSQFITDGLIRPITDGIRQAYTNFSDTMSTPGMTAGSMASPWTASPWTASPGMPNWGMPSGMAGTRPRHWGYQGGWQGGWQAPGCGKCGGRGCDECCRPCHEDCDPCHCRCCITDADLVVYSRLGERRVVPLRIENRWRRERDIRMELGNWATSGGKPGPVKAILEPPAPIFRLGPCETRLIPLIVETDFGERAEAGRILDVDDCTVYYCHLCVEGCDMRPIRIALALLPRDCHPYCIECRCGCCC